MRSRGSNDKLNDKNAWGLKMKSWSRVLITGLAVGAVAVGGVFAANANEPTSADVQQPLVEDFTYPGAARILAEDNVELISGDGHVLYVPCAAQPTNGVGQMEVHSEDLSVGDGGKICFKVTGSVGQITMKIPHVFEIRGDGFGLGNGHNGTATVQPQSGTTKTVALNPNESIQVGTGIAGGKPEVLVRLDIKP